MTGIDVKVIRVVVFASLFGVAVLCAVAVCAFLLYKHWTSRIRKWRLPSLPATTRIKISGSPLDADAHIKLLHQQPHLGGSRMTIAEMSPLMRHKPLRYFKQTEADQLRMGSCNTLTTQHQITSSDGSTKTLIRPLSQSAQYLARPSSQMCQQTSLTNLVGSGYASDSNQGHERNIDDSQQTPQVELTLVYVSASAQLLVHVHRLSNVTLVHYGKESSNATVKVVLDGRVKQTFRSALAAPTSPSLHQSTKSQQRFAQVFKFSDVTTDDLLDGNLTITIYLGRRRWKSDKKIGFLILRLAEMALADGVPQFCMGFLRHGKPDGIDRKKKNAQAEPCRPMTGVPELGQLLISLQREQQSTVGASSCRLKILIHRARGLPPTKTVFEPNYIVVINASYPDGGSEIKETKPARGKAPEWNQTIEFDVTDRPIVSCWLHLVLIRKTKRGHSPNAAIGHLTLGANSTPDGERHWQALVNTHDLEIPQWHRLTSR